MDNSAPEIPKRILCVDDEDNVLRSLKRLFMSEDYEVMTALSGQEALKLLRDIEIPVIISDQRMPIMSGARFLEKSREVSPDSIRIILTGHADVEAAVGAINQGGAFRYASKPWNDTELLLIVKEALDKYTLVKENRFLAELTRRQNEELKKWNTELEFYVQQQTIDLTNRNKELKKLNEKLTKNLNDILASMSGLIELRDHTVHSHSHNIALLSTMIARNMGLDESVIETISTAALLHDIGKIGESDLAMTKTVAELTPAELAEYRKHPVRGQAVIDCIEDLREPGLLVRGHHEWYNGKGFPDGLKAESIPLGARIISIADSFDRALHNEMRSTDGALQDIRSRLGSQFDPSLFQSLEKTSGEFSKSTTSADEMMEVELTIKDLAPGMELSRDVRTGTGLLMLRQNTILNTKNIETLYRGFHLDPAKGGVFVLRKKSRP
jgi:response regulator RpfG family c-di-GMP phosphodiesterase